MQSDHSSSALDYYSQLLPSLQHPPPLQPLTSSALASFSLSQQPSLQHTMSVADPFSPSWPLFNPPSPAGRKQSSAVFGGGNAGWLENAQQLLPTVSSAGLSLSGLSSQSQLLSQLSASLMQRPSASVQSLPQQQSAIFQPLPQRAGVSGASSMMQPSPLMSPPPLQQQLNVPTNLTQQQLAQLRSSQQQFQQQLYAAQRVPSMTGMAAPLQPFSSPTQSLQTSPLSFLQTFRPAASNSSSSNQQLLQQPVAPLQPAINSTVELATALLSYLSSAELQRGLLYVNRLWRFKSLYVLQSRQVNIQVQLTHLYLGPFRASNMLELVFSLQVQQRLVNSAPVNHSGSGSNLNFVSPVLPLRPLQLPGSVPSSPASVARTPLKFTMTTSNLLNSPSTVARATVCTPMAMSAVVKAKELSKGDALLNSPSMMLSGGKHLSKKKLREAALLAESKYNSIIECGILPSDTASPASAAHSTQRIFKQYSSFFGKQVEVYTALSDPTQQTLFRASSLAEKFDYATNKVGMYLSRRRLHSGGIYQATGFRSKPAGRTGLKCGGYFLTIEACKEFENHFQYGGLTEEQRKEKASSPAASSSRSGCDREGREAGEDVDEGDLGDGEESEDEGNEAGERRSADKLKAENKALMTAHSTRPLSAVTKKLVDTGFGHSSPSLISAAVNSPSSRKRSASDDSPEDSPDSGDVSSSPSSTFKRLRSDEAGMNTTDSCSGSDTAGRMSSASVGKQGSGSDEDSSDRSPGPSSRTTHFHSHSHSQLHSSASTSSSASVGSSSSYHRSAFKAPTPLRSSSFQASPSSVASVGSLGSNSNDSTSPGPSSGRDISPSSSPGSQQVPTLPASASFLPSISSSSPSPSFTSSAHPSLSRWHSFASPLASPSSTQSLFSSPSTTNSYVQLSSPPLGVSHKFNGLSLAGAAASQLSNTSMAAPVMPLSLSSSHSLEAAFASALLQSGQAGGGMRLAGPSASVGANGLLNLNNLTLQQLQQLLSGHLTNPQQPLNTLSQHPSLLNYMLMSATGQATSGVQAGQQQPTLQPVQFG